MEVVSYNNYAGFAKRFFAFLIDRICLSLLLYGILGFSMHVPMYHARNLFGTRTFAVELIMMAYFVLCESSSWQGTLGKRLFGMKVVTENYQRLSAADAIIRYLGKYLSTVFLLLGYIWIIFDSRKQGWHDKIAKTFVING